MATVIASRISTWLGLEFMVGTFALHGVAHVVRGGTPLITVLVGWALLVAMVGVLVARRRGLRTAAATLVCGVLLTFGLLNVHVVPVWTVISDPWHGMHGTAAWLVSLYLALFGAVWAVATAWYELRRDPR